MGEAVRVAIYMRLSREDGNADRESNSIRMQRMLLTEYVRQHFEEYELMEFTDDGYTGTNFNRPGVCRLLELAGAGEVDCIIVKDFSRFSRDYIGLGDHMERFFPAWGIRFISVNDHYDSNVRNASGDMDIAFRGLLYDFYSRDLSVKVKSSLYTRKKKGQYASANCPFGYKKDPEDRHRLLIEEDEARVVRRIFALAEEGKNYGEIAGLLNREGIETPAESGIRKGKLRRKPKGEKFFWSSAGISRILKNRAYVGDMVYGKTMTPEVGGKRRAKPEEEWEIYPDHHAPLVSRDVFEKVGKINGRKREDMKRNG